MDEKTIKKIIYFVLIVAIVGVCIWGGFWLKDNWKKLTSAGKIYTEKELEQYGEEQTNAVKEQYSEYKRLYEVKTQEIKTLNANITKLESDLKTSTDLNAEQLETINILRSEKDSLNAELAKLSDKVAYYEQLLADKENTEFYKLSFLNTDESIVDILYVSTEDTSYVSLIPTLENSDIQQFAGWSTDKVNVIDFSSYELSQSTTFYATYGTYLLDNMKDYSSQDVKAGYIIADTEDFTTFVSTVNAGQSFADVKLYIVNDIDFNNQAISAIGTVSGNEKINTFKGYLDGRNYSIKNFDLQMVASDTNRPNNYGGLFNSIENATIKNLTLQNATVSTDALLNSGILCGQSKNSLIENIKLIACNYNGLAQKPTNYSRSVGGLIGYDYSSIIMSCSSDVDFTLQEGKDDENVLYEYNIGGLIGFANNSSLYDCINFSNILPKTQETCVWKVGGIVSQATLLREAVRCINYGDVSYRGAGIAYTTQYFAQFVNCLNFGACNYNFFGTIENLLVNSPVQFKNCYAFGANTGSIIGYKDIGSYNIFENCHYGLNADTTKILLKTETTANGITASEATTAQVKIQNFYTNSNNFDFRFLFDFNNTWQMSAETGLPVLK